MECEHKWFFQGSDYKEEQKRNRTCELSRIDTYYCEKCLERREVVAKKDTIYVGDPLPYWFKWQ